MCTGVITQCTLVAESTLAHAAFIWSLTRVGPRVVDQRRLVREATAAVWTFKGFDPFMNQLMTSQLGALRECLHAVVTCEVGFIIWCALMIVQVSLAGKTFAAYITLKRSFAIFLNCHHCSHPGNWNLMCTVFCTSPTTITSAWIWYLNF